MSAHDQNRQKYLSVCIPTYEMRGQGHIFLKQSLDRLVRQTFNDFEVVISDFSRNELIKELCQRYSDSLDIKYFKNENPLVGISTNTNNAILHATGKLIKILFQDDFLYDEKSLEHTVAHFDLAKDTWLVSACEHSKDGISFYRSHYPKYNKNVYRGNNTIGSPSVLTIKNDSPLLFDTNLKWLVDCDYYRRCYDVFGPPKILNEITTVIRTGEHQITTTEADESVRQREYHYMVDKYSKKAGKVSLKMVTVVAVTGIDPAGALKALQISMAGIDFYQAVLIAHNKPAELPAGITFKQCRPTDLQSTDRKNTNDYSKFMAYGLWEYIESDFALIVHNDAYVLRPHQWREDFLAYDYIGAPWPPAVHFTPNGTAVRVGNGGFSLRSKRLLNVLNELKLPFTDNGTGYFHEDGILCVYYRKQLEENGTRFAPVALASLFSREKDCLDSRSAPFGFHNNKKAIPWFFAWRQTLRKMGLGV